MFGEIGESDVGLKSRLPYVYFLLRVNVSGQHRAIATVSSRLSRLSSVWEVEVAALIPPGRSPLAPGMILSDADDRIAEESEAGLRLVCRTDEIFCLAVFIRIRRRQPIRLWAWSDIAIGKC